jgi:hypothetical protein
MDLPDRGSNLRWFDFEAMTVNIYITETFQTCYTCHLRAIFHLYSWRKQDHKEYILHVKTWAENLYCHRKEVYERYDQTMLYYNGSSTTTGLTRNSINIKLLFLTQKNNNHSLKREKFSAHVLTCKMYSLWSCFRHEYRWNIAHWTLNNNPSDSHPISLTRWWRYMLKYVLDTHWTGFS